MNLSAFALVYQSTGEFELAEQQFKAALKADPYLSRARNNYAAFLYSQGRFVAAEAEFARVTDDTLYNGRPTAFVNLGLCRLQLSNPQGAEAAFSRALSMDRRNPVALGVFPITDANVLPRQRNPLVQGRLRVGDHLRATAVFRHASRQQNKRQ